VVLQCPSSPDVSMLDSGVFPNTQMKVNRSGASSIDEIRKAVNAVWDNDITTSHLNAVAARVRRKKNIFLGALEANGSYSTLYPGPT